MMLLEKIILILFLLIESCGSVTFEKVKSIASGCSTYIQNVIYISGNVVGISCSDNSVRLCDYTTSSCGSAFASGHSLGAFGLTLSKDKNYLVSSSWDKTLIVWKLVGLTSATRLISLSGHTDYVWGVVTLPDGRIASGSKDSTIRIWDTPGSINPLPTITITVPGSYEIRALAISTDSTYLIASYGTSNSGSQHGLNLYAISTLSSSSTAAKNNYGHGDFIRSIISLPSGDIVSCSLDHTCRVWSSILGLKNAFTQHTSGTSVNSIISVSGSYVISGGGDANIFEWDTTVNSAPIINSVASFYSVYGIALLTPLTFITVSCSFTTTNSATIYTNSLDVYRPPCTSPTVGNYVKAPCSSLVPITGDTTIAKCSSCPSGKYVVAACVMGSRDIAGKDTSMSDCTTIGLPGGAYATNLCTSGDYSTVGSDFAYSTCSPPTSSQYVASVCVSGGLTLLGSNTVIQSCTVPNFDQFVTSKCVSGSITNSGTNTVIKTCTKPSGNNYTKTSCVTGSISSIGTDAIISSCYVPVTGVEYVLNLCVQGSSTIVGSNTVVRPCTVPLASQYTIRGCMSVTANGAAIGIDTAISACYTPKIGEYITTVCNSGSTIHMGSDAVAQTCSAPTSGSYVKLKCYSGSEIQLGNDTTIASCTTTLPSESQYVVLTCTMGRSTFEGNDLFIDSCISPASYQFTQEVCLSGNLSVPGTNSLVKQCSNPPPGFFTTSVCISGAYKTLGNDTMFAQCTTPYDPPNGSFVKSLCTLNGVYNMIGTDFSIGTCIIPKPGQFVYSPCFAGNRTTLGSDTSLCNEGYTCTTTGLSQICPSGFYCPQGSTHPIACLTKGSYCPQGSMTQNACSAGSFCQTSSQTASCAEGTFSIGNQTSCLVCPEGYFCIRGAISPTLCSSGSWSSLGSSSATQCLPCERGYSCSGGVKSVCSQGTFSVEGQSQCTPCKPGFSCINQHQIPCLAGTFNSGFNNSISCIPCGIGKYCDVGSISESDCLAGFFCEDATTQLPCEKIGSYCPSRSTVEKPCPSGSYCSTSADIKTCRSPQYCPLASKFPLDCPSGSYCTNPDAISDCLAPKYCPINSTTALVCKYPMETLKFKSTSIFDCVCLPGSYFNPNAGGENDSSFLPCLPCPSSFHCENSNTTLATMKVQDGFFRLSANNFAVASCSNISCANSTCNSDNGFAVSFLCSKCLPNYFRSSNLQVSAVCESCANTYPGLEVGLSFLAGAVILFILVYSKLRRSSSNGSVGNKEDKGDVSSIEKENISINNLVTSSRVSTNNNDNNPKSKSKMSVIQRQALSHFQVIGIVGKFKLRYPSILNSMFSTSDSASSLGFSGLGGGVKCLFVGMEIPLPFRDIIVNLVIYLVGLLLIFLFFLIYGLGCCFSKRRRRSGNNYETLKIQLIVSIICLSYVMYSSFVRSFFQSFSCLLFPGDIINNRRLQGDLDVICYENIHLYFLQILTAPIGIVIVFGFPLLAVMLLWRKFKHGNLFSEYNLRIYSFLYEGYKSNLWYWELIILVRKIALSFTSIFLSTISTSYSDNSYEQGLAALCIFIISMELQSYFKPYNDEELNRIESLGLRVSTTTLLLALWTFSSDNSEQDFQTFVTLFIILLNVSFAAYIFYALGKGYSFTVIEYIKRTFYYCYKSKNSHIKEDEANNNNKNSIVYNNNNNKSIPLTNLINKSSKDRDVRSDDINDSGGEKVITFVNNPIIIQTQQSTIPPLPLKKKKWIDKN